jgi:uncharacterized protein (TIGR03083 family)
MDVVRSQQIVQDAASIPYVSEDEAYALLKVQLERLLELLENLHAQDWQQPTACTAWTVRDMVAHQAGGYASGTGYGEMIRQYGRMPQKGQLPEDAVNENQLRERAGRSTDELIAELRAVGPVAIEKWAYRFRLAKYIAIPHPVGGTLSMRHLMMVIHSRDTWMHRLDICRAVGREFEQTPEQDGRIVALIMRDVNEKLAAQLNGNSILFELAGPAGGTWKVGTGAPCASIRMDALDFCVFASGRYTYEEARGLASISGDVHLADSALKNLLILF